MYRQSGSCVNPSDAKHPQNIVMITCGDRVQWPARDISDSTHGVYLWIADMVARGWTALRDGDTILMHPVDGDESPHARWRA